MRSLSIGLVTLGLFAACSSSNSDTSTPTSTVTNPDGGTPNGAVDAGPQRCAAPPCADGDACIVASDCTSNICTQNTCIPIGCTDGIKDRDETDVDCGGSCILGCAPTKDCLVDTDCLDLVCGTSKTCTPPTKGDHLKNGNETDTDCGSSTPNRFDTHAPACDAGKTCIADADCKSGGCNQDNHTCALARSCATTNGGQTCGTGDVTSPNKRHEDCCTSATISPYSYAGGTGIYTNSLPQFRLDKYTITAGRMRKFITAVGGNVQAWVKANRDKILAPDQLPSTLDDYLPKGYVQDDSGDTCQGDTNGGTYNCNYGALAQLSGFRYNTEPGGDFGYACDMGVLDPEHGVDDHIFGARTFYLTDEERAALYPDKTVRERQHLVPKERLAQKAMECANYYMLAAFCAWDGGRLETLDEYNAAFRGDGTYGDLYPWGDSDQSRRAIGFYDINDSNLYPNYNFNPPDWPQVKDAQGNITDPGADSQCTGNSTSEPGCLALAKPDATANDPLYKVTHMGAGTTRYSIENPNLDATLKQVFLTYRLRRANGFYNYGNAITNTFLQSLGGTDLPIVAAEQIDQSIDQSVVVAPPGRYPSGYGKLGGHADLIGNVMEITATTADGTPPVRHGNPPTPSGYMLWTRNGSYEVSHFNTTTMVGGVSTKRLLTKYARAGGRCARPLDIYKALP